MRATLRFMPGELEPLIWQTANHLLVDPEAKKGGKRPYIAAYVDGLFNELRIIAERRHAEGCSDSAIHLGYVVSRTSDAMRLESNDLEWLADLPQTPEDTFNVLHAQEARTYVNSLLSTFADIDVSVLDP